MPPASSSSHSTGMIASLRAATTSAGHRIAARWGRLSMRRTSDHRPAHVAKLRLLRDVAHDRTVAIVVDDDPDVCDAYEGAGFTVLRATWAIRSDALHRAQEEDGRT